jgi:hypothetical protein
MSEATIYVRGKIREGPFCASMILDTATNRIVRTAPLLRFMLGWERERASAHIRKIGWEATIRHDQQQGTNAPEAVSNG